MKKAKKKYIITDLLFEIQDTGCLGLAHGDDPERWYRVGGRFIGVTGRFGLGIRNEAGQRLIEFCKRMHGS